MSKQALAKQQQGYSTEPTNCGNCKHRSCVKELPSWMIGDRIYDTEIGRQRHSIEKNQRCTIGGFAVKKTARCNMWEQYIPTTPQP